MICMKKVRFSSHPRAKVRCQGPPGSARAQPCNDGRAVVLGDDKDDDDDDDDHIYRGYQVTVELIN